MNRTKILILVMGLLTISFCLPGIAEEKEMSGEIYKGWRLATQAWTFHTGTFFEAVDNAHELGLKYIEAYGNQPLSREFPKETTGFTMSAETKQKIKAKLAQTGIQVKSFGVVTPAQNAEEEWRKFFEFAKDMGIETIVSEPNENAFDMLDKLCQEYKINLAIHNHPRPSHYWNPDTVLKVCEGRSKYIGACADIGHWMRSGINPIEAIKKLKGRIIELHAKDLNKANDPGAHDVIWGAGAGNFKDILEELDKQGFKGQFVIEYEYNYGKSMPELAGCIANFNRFAAELSHAETKDLFNKDLSNAIYKEGSWAFDAEGVLSPKGVQGYDLDLWTKEKYGNFILDLEFKVAHGSNSGVFLRTGSIQNWINTAIEVQIHESTDGTAHGQCGAIYDCLSPSKNAEKKTGEWNHYVITCLDNKIYVELNGEQIIDMDLNKWTEAHKNPDGTPNKFTTAYKDMPRIGNIGLQYHGTPIWYKNLKIKSLD